MITDVVSQRPRYQSPWEHDIVPSVKTHRRTVHVRSQGVGIQKTSRVVIFLRHLRGERPRSRPTQAAHPCRHGSCPLCPSASKSVDTATEHLIITPPYIDLVFQA